MIETISINISNYKSWYDSPHCDHKCYFCSRVEWMGVNRERIFYTINVFDVRANTITIMLLDEPSESYDPSNRDRLCRIILPSIGRALKSISFENTTGDIFSSFEDIDRQTRYLVRDYIDNMY